jgi:hypothetical protein
MAIQVQLRRGTTAQNNSFTGVVGEVTVDTDVDTLRVHDGATVGGATVVTTTATQTLTNKTIGAFTLSGNITGNANISGTISVNSSDSATAIVNSGSNAVGNIGSSSNYFNTVFAKATSALYADLAEMYEADSQYEPGTVVCFGGEQEITKSTQDRDRSVAGVVSSNPAYIMNSSMSSDRAVTVALMGKVPTQVTGSVRKGDLMVSAGDGTARADNDPPVGSVLGKSLENFDGSRGIINIVVGRL